MLESTTGGLDGAAAFERGAGAGGREADEPAGLPAELARAARTKHRQLRNQMKAEVTRMDRKGSKAKGSGAAAGEALLAAGIEQERALIHEMESRYPERMNKGGVLSDYINRGSGSVHTGA